ncbi:MAG: GNAT family N-acetyltransferase [Saprospiraceae bacterium]|nr:GNAT family N-acetyltransferase [Saprospiraceae bacterium]
MFLFKKTNASDPDFITLVKLLDSNLKITDGDDHSFYNQFNSIDDIKHVITVYDNDVPIACGALKHYDQQTMEVKRMYTIGSKRGKGIATELLKQLEDWAFALGYSRCILETGSRQVSAIALYKKSNYQIIENYAQYKNVENSICFEKQLNKKGDN